jgi:hypothetical protein
MESSHERNSKKKHASISSSTKSKSKNNISPDGSDDELLDIEIPDEEDEQIIIERLRREREERLKVIKLSFQNFFKHSD